MKIFNVGALEIVFIVLIAFIVLGPKKAVKIAGDLGRWVHNLANSQLWREAREVSEDISNLPREIIQGADIQQKLEDLERSSYTVDPPLNDRSGSREVKKNDSSGPS